MRSEPRPLWLFILATTFISSLLFSASETVTVDGLNFPVFQMQPNYKVETLTRAEQQAQNIVFPYNSMIYYTGKDRDMNRVVVKDSLLQVLSYSTGNWELLTTPISWVPQEHTHMHSAIFVLDTNGNLYITRNSFSDYIHHSSLVAGESVLAAGRMVVKDGVIVAIDNESGHYLPTPESLKLLLKLLVARGYSVSHSLYIGKNEVTRTLGARDESKRLHLARIDDFHHWKDSCRDLLKAQAPMLGGFNRPILGGFGQQ